MGEALLYAIPLGIALGVFYDVLRLFIRIFNSRFFLDFIFWVISAFVFFSYLLVFNNGEIRAVFVVSVSCGFIFYILTAGSITAKFEDKIAKKVKIWLKKLKNRLKSFKKVLHYINKVYYNVKVKVFKGMLVNKNEGDKNGEENEKQ